MNKELHCAKCGAILSTNNYICTQCNTIHDSFRYKSRVAAAALAIFGGSIGLHRFFLGQWWGIFYLLFFWTSVPSILSLIEGIVFISTSQKKWNQKYNNGIFLGAESGTVIIACAIVLPFIILIGILAAIAIPAYSDYITRAIVAEGVSAASRAEMAVTEYVIKDHRYPTNNIEAGFEKDFSNEHIKSIDIDKGLIYVEMKPETGIKGFLVFVPSYSDSGITWSCKESTVEEKYLPLACKK